MDPSSTSFDNTYYKLIFQQKALFSSDKALLDSSKTKNLVATFANSKDAFTKAFIKSMIKMSSITGGQEVRKNCKVVNQTTYKDDYVISSGYLFSFQKGGDVKQEKQQV